MENKEPKEEEQINTSAEVTAESTVQESHFEPASSEENIEIEVEQVENFNAYTKEELVKAIEVFLTEPDYIKIKSKINPLKEAFNDLVAHERQLQFEKYIENGGEKDDFEYKPDELEVQFSEALKKSHRKRTDFIENQEKLREEHLAAKQEILKQLKALIQNEENMTKAFHSFHELQARWRIIGPVPPKSVHDLWMTYKLYIEKFYDLIKINRELQELDQKKNLEMKLRICEQVEELLLEPSLNKALSRLQAFQTGWREVGPVPREKRMEIGERFKAAGDKIMERKKEYVEQLKLKQEEALKAKIILCEKVEQIILNENPTHHEVQEKLKQILDLQTEWRKAGLAEKTANEEIWKRFKTISDNFFRRKHEFYQQKKKEYQVNLQAKTELCMQAEGLMHNTDWRNTTAELKRLSEAWKKIGPVGAKMSDKIWNRFKTACDTFFRNRKTHFVSVDKEYEDNYNKKIQLLERIELFKPGGNREESLDQIKNFQREWTETGLVPIEKKDEIHARYKKLIDGFFNGMQLSEKERRDLRFKEKMEHLKSTPQAKEKIGDEKRVLINKLSQLKNDVTVWENNIGFFAKSKNADEIKQEFELKIKKAKDEISFLKEQINLIKSF